MSRCECTDCIAPARHTVTEGGVPLAEYCDEHFRVLNETLAHFGSQYRELITAGVDERMADRIVSERIDKWKAS